MSITGYRLDGRNVETFRSDLRDAAMQASLRLPDGEVRSWVDLLFRGGDFQDPSEPSQALLAANLELREGLARHLSGLPEQALLHWLETILKIPRLPAVPDRTVVSATADPSLVPIVVPIGTALRGGKDVFGNERRYRTTDTLTVHGAELIGLRSYEISGTRDATSRSEDPDTTLTPHPGSEPAPHTCRFYTEIVRFSGGSLRARLGFDGGDPRRLEGAVWRHSSSTGPREAIVTSATATGITLLLMDECQSDVEGELPWLEVGFPVGTTPTDFRPEWFDFGFNGATAEVVQRTGVVPDAAYYNDGLVDVTKEFQPYGPTARRGDAFYVRSDEVFSKPVSELRVELSLLSSGGSGGGGGLQPVAWGGPVQNWFLLSHMESLPLLGELVGGAPTPRIEWQRRTTNDWDDFASTSNSLRSFTTPTPASGNDPLSRPFTLGGGTGHFIRGFLAEGDFGWVRYQERIAAFAAAAANGSPTVSAGDLVPPDPPVVSRLTLDYETRAVPVDRVVSSDAWSEREWSGSGRFYAFSIPIEVTSDRKGGMVAFGLRLGAASAGSSVSVYFDVDSAAACEASGVPDARWEYWSPEGWAALDVADATLGLRQSGLLRFVAPSGWVEGGVLGAEGKWVRVSTHAPSRLGSVRGVVVDAVEARYERRSTVDPLTDTTPETPLAEGDLKGVVQPIAGIKKLANLAGTRGKAPEKDPAYLRRAVGVVRHRNRSIQAWDYEEQIMVNSPELHAVRCLPHTGPDGASAPGWVGLVVVPAGSEPMPLPTVRLVDQIRGRLARQLPLHARPAVLCPLYAPVTVEVELTLLPGVGALTGKNAVTEAIETWLHPTTHAPPRFGEGLFASSVVAHIESLPVVDYVSHFVLRGPDGAAVEHVAVDPCRGLVASSGAHTVRALETL